MTMPLFKYKKNVYSQNGEDGIIEEILKRMDMYDKKGNYWAVDVGAWDGVYLSNIFNLIKNGPDSWSAVFIECDPEKSENLRKLSHQYTSIIPIECSIGRYNTDENCLDNILSRTDIPNDFDLLSIDIDSYDSDVWDTLQKYSSKIVVIETNSGVGPEITFRHGNPKPGELLNQGTSFAAMEEIAKQKGYKLVCYTGNSIFVREEFYHKIKNTMTPLELYRSQYFW